MYQIDAATVSGGKIVLSNLPFAEGQRVEITVAAAAERADNRISIDEVRRRLKGCVERFDDPFEPVIPTDSSDMR